LYDRFFSSFLIAIFSQRSILEADQEEENEEAGDMNDDELNMMLARSDHEIAVFREIDDQRERDTVDEALEGRGQRRRNVASYTDGLSDDTWAMVCYPVSFCLFFCANFSCARHWKKERTFRHFWSDSARRAPDDSTTSFSVPPTRRTEARRFQTLRAA
jgi:hypothetical protein